MTDEGNTGDIRCVLSYKCDGVSLDVTVLWDRRVLRHDGASSQVRCHRCNPRFVKCGMSRV